MANTTTRSIRVNDELWAAAVAITAARGETVTGIVVARLERYVRAHGDQAPKVARR